MIDQLGTVLVFAGSGFAMMVSVIVVMMVSVIVVGITNRAVVVPTMCHVEKIVRSLVPRNQSKQQDHSCHETGCDPAEDEPKVLVGKAVQQRVD